MRSGIFSSLMVLLAGMGAALAQAPATPPAAAPSEPPARSAPAQTAADVSLDDSGPAAGEPASACCPSQDNFCYGDVEYVLWKLRSSPSGDDYGGRSGGRFTFGKWLEPDQVFGCEATGFVLEGGSVTTPGITGAAKASMWGVETNMRSTRCYFGNAAFDLLCGFRYIQVNESVNDSGSRIYATAHNHYFGPQVGASFDWQWGPHVSLSGFAKIGVGAADETAKLTSPVLIFENRHTRYNYVPELNLTLGYQWTPNLRTTAGYNLLFFNNLERPINLSGGQEFWAQGLSLGLRYRY